MPWKKTGSLIAQDLLLEVMENKKIAVIIDTDPGVDDIAALACSLYDDKMDIKLITTVSGNKDINIVTRNCMFALELMQKTDIPVVRGSGRALLRISPDASYIHQNDGMGGFTPPKEVKAKPISKNAVSEMLKVVKANGINLVYDPGYQTTIEDITQLNTLTGTRYGSAKGK